MWDTHAGSTYVVTKPLLFFLPYLPALPATCRAWAGVKVLCLSPSNFFNEWKIIRPIFLGRFRIDFLGGGQDWNETQYSQVESHSNGIGCHHYTAVRCRVIKHRCLLDTNSCRYGGGGGIYCKHVTIREVHDKLILATNKEHNNQPCSWGKIKPWLILQKCTVYLGANLHRQQHKSVLWLSLNFKDIPPWKGHYAVSTTMATFQSSVTYNQWR